MGAALLGTGLLPAAEARADGWTVEGIGIVAGAAPDGDEAYRQVDLAMHLSTPGRLGAPAGLHLRLQVEGAFGVLWASDDTAVAGSAGPRLVLRHGALPLWLELGSRAGGLSDHRFGDDDLGGAFQFTSHAGLGLRWRQLRIGARVQHTSNAGVYRENDGYNLVGGALEWRF